MSPSLKDQFQDMHSVDSLYRQVSLSHLVVLWIVNQQDSFLYFAYFYVIYHLFIYFTYLLTDLFSYLFHAGPMLIAIFIAETVILFSIIYN